MQLNMTNYTIKSLHVNLSASTAESVQAPEGIFVCFSESAAGQMCLICSQPMTGLWVNFTQPQHPWITEIMLTEHMLCVWVHNIQHIKPFLFYLRDDTVLSDSPFDSWGYKWQ